MALLMDGRISNEGDLQQYENAILDVAANEHIDTSGKMAIAAREIGSEVLLFLLGVPLRDPKAYSRRLIGASDVAVTPSLKAWHIYKTIQLIYGDAYGNQLNERYLAKWTEYQGVTLKAKHTCLKIGVGLVFSPVPAAEAPQGSIISGTCLPGTYYFGASWTNAGQQEGAMSDITSLTNSPGQTISLSLGAGVPPRTAAGWNLYAGTNPNHLLLQNGAPLPIGSSWTVPASGLVQGRLPGAGQMTEWLVVDDQRIQRG